jgi:hypothetical protein
MTTATVIETRRNGNPIGDVGERVELARYVVPVGERVVYGQRLNGVVRFLPRSDAVVVRVWSRSEDDCCRSRAASRREARSNAVRGKRPNAEARLLNSGEASRPW